MSMASTSPRLPSPPPQAEIQLGPQSPSMGAQRQAQQIEQTALDANAKRRIHPGTKSSDMAAGPPLVPLNELDSAFQLQEHLAALHYFHTKSNTAPMTRETSQTLARPPPGTDKTLWLYELCRFLISQCNTLIVGFLFDNPACSAGTCPEMRASEWQFLCAVHDQPKSCCAIDYCCHTLDWAANVVTNPKIFPSRFVVAADAHDRNAALKNLVNVFRRLHRVFAHAWFQHRRVFWSVELQTGLYVFFKTVCDVYDLLPAENYKLPPEAEGLEPGPQEREFVPTIAKPPARTDTAKNLSDEENFGGIGRTNTRRHVRSSPSTGSAVTTVIEADEHDEETGNGRRRTKGLHISAPPETVEEEGEQEQESTAETKAGMDIPVIVDQAVMENPPNRPSSVIPLKNAPPHKNQKEGQAEKQPEAEGNSEPETALDAKSLEEESEAKTVEAKASEEPVAAGRQTDADPDETIVGPDEDQSEGALKEHDPIDSAAVDGAGYSKEATSIAEEGEGTSTTADIIAEEQEAGEKGDGEATVVGAEQASEPTQKSE